MFNLLLRPLAPSDLPWPLANLQPWMQANKMPMMLLHVNVILTGWAACLIISYLAYHLAPRLFPGAFARGKPNMRLNFCHQAVSLVHAVVSCVLSVWNMVFTDMPVDKLYGYSTPLGVQCALTVGYFLWDIFSTAANIDYYGPAFMLHAVIGFLPLLIALSPVMIGYVAWFMLFEVSSVFLHCHWFLDKLGGSKRLILVNDVLLLVTFFSFRILFGWYVIITAIRQMAAYRGAMNPFFFPVICFALAASLSLNHFWFYRLFRATLRHMGLSEHRHHHKNHHHKRERTVSERDLDFLPGEDRKRRVSKRIAKQE
mgnify:CR=1 FL=1